MSSSLRNELSISSENIVYVNHQKSSFAFNDETLLNANFRSNIYKNSVKSDTHFTTQFK